MRKPLATALCAALLALMCAPAAAAAPEEASPTYTFDIVLAGDAPYKSVLLDERVCLLAQSSLANLRVLDSGGGMVPYFLYGSEQATTLAQAEFPARFLREFVKDGEVFQDYAAEVSEGHDLYGNLLRFSTSSAGFAKDVRVQGSYDNIEWAPVCSGTLYRVDAGERLDISLGEVVRYPYYRICLPNNKERIQVDTVTLVYRAEQTAHTAFTGTYAPAFAREELPGVTTLTVAPADIRHLELDSVRLLTDSVFKRTVRAETAGDYGRTLHADTLYNLRFQDQAVTHTALDLFGAQVPDQALVIVIENGDDAPLSVSGLEFTLRHRRLVFEARPGESYRLLVGDPMLSAPRYDIASYADSVIKQSPDLCGLSAMTVVAPVPVPEPKNDKLFFNLALGAASGVLVLLIARSAIQKKNPGEGE